MNKFTVFYTNYFIILFLTTMLFESCAQNSQTANAVFTEINQVVLPVSDSRFVAPYDVQLSDDLSKIYVYLNRNYIYIYDLPEKKLTDSILLPSKFPLYSFNLIDKDRILLLFNPASDKFYNHDHTLFLINTKGDVLNDFSIVETPAISSKKDETPDSAYYVSLLFQKLQYCEDRAYINFYKYATTNIGDTDYDYQNSFIPGFINVENGKFTAISNIKIPEIRQGEYVPIDVEYVETKIGHNGNPIYAFAHTDLLLEYNLQNNTIIKHRLKYSKIDTIAPSKQICSGTLANSNFKYSYLYFDNYRNYYYRLIQLPENKYGKWKYAFVVADTSFNVLGEGMIQEYINPSKLFFSQDYIWSYNSPKTYSEKGKVVFSKFQLDFNKLSLDTCSFNSIQKQNNANNKHIAEYLKNYTHISDSTFAALIVPVTYSCPSCVKQTLNFYSRNQKELIENPVYLILIDKNDNLLNDIAKEYSLKLSNPKIKTDKSDVYFNYHNFDSYNPRLVLMKNNKLKSDKVYNPSEIIELQKTLLKFLGLKYEQKSE